MPSSAAATRRARCREALLVAALALLGHGAVVHGGDAGGWRFHAAGEGLPRSGEWREHFALADLDGDGRPDLVHGPARRTAGGPVVFRSDGRGRWEPWAALRVPPLAYGYGGVAVGDVTGDGVPDVVLAPHLRTPLALGGARDGGFTDRSRGLEAAADGSHPTAHAVALVDWDRDGRLDVAVVGEGPTRGDGGAAVALASGLYLWTNRGDGGWLPLRHRASARGPAAGALAVADVDGDGWPDAVTGTNDLGRRDVLYRGGAGGVAERVTLAALPERSLVEDVALADVDGDGTVDLLAAVVTRGEDGWSGGVVLVPGPIATATTGRTLARVDDRGGVVALGVGDVDADGVRDVAAVTARGTLVTLRGDGRGGFRRQPDVPCPLGTCRGRHVLLADVDGEAGDEILVSYADEDGACPSHGGLIAWKRDGGGP